MGTLKETDVNSRACFHGGGGGDHQSVVVELPLGCTFDLEKAVCSHGLFMMAPNHWDRLSKTLQRPFCIDSDDHAASVSSSSLIVRISQPSHTPHSLLLRILDTETLVPEHQQSLVKQVKRMLRLSEEEVRNVMEFQEIYGDAKERGFGGVFRSPTLFEDMVKCILLCNCQWPRTLRMARALCELQVELQYPSSGVSVAEGDEFRSPTAEIEHFAPKTPAGKESRKKIVMQENFTNLAESSAEVKAGMEAEAAFRSDSVDISDCLQGKLKSLEKTEIHSYGRIGNFPSPRELASLDVNFLAKRCNLGYRASRISSLARSVVEGRIQLRQLEEDCGKACISNYSKLAAQLKEIDGFGPFTCANVLMCMGFYHEIPADSETIRHLKQVHGRKSTIQNIKRDIEVIYGKYAPFQFLVYWSEVWSFYEERFGKLSELPESHYKLITATNMRCKKGSGGKRIKIW